MSKRPSTRARIDWGAARAHFVALDPPRTYAAVARAFGVSDVAVRNHARLEQWAQLAADADRAAADKALAAAVKTREQRALQDARIRDLAANRVEARVEADDVSDEWVRQVLADADKRVRLNEGEATDVYAVAVVQAGIRDLIAGVDELVVRLVGEGLAGRELLVRFRGELPAMMQERLALVEGSASS